MDYNKDAVNLAKLFVDGIIDDLPTLFKMAKSNNISRNVLKKHIIGYMIFKKSEINENTSELLRLEILYNLRNKSRRAYFIKIIKGADFLWRIGIMIGRDGTKSANELVKCFCPNYKREHYL